MRVALTHLLLSLFLAHAAYDGLGKPYWNGGVPTATSSPPYRAVVENDGNFVVYGAEGPIWATNTCCL